MSIFWVEAMTYKAICIYFLYNIVDSLYGTRMAENVVGWQRLAGACIVHTILAIIRTIITDNYCNVHVLYINLIHQSFALGYTPFL